MRFKSDLDRISYGVKPESDSILMWTIYNLNGIMRLIKLRIVLLIYG